MSAADSKVDAALQAALAENARLKKTLAKLQAVERDLIADGKLQGDAKDAKAAAPAAVAAKPVEVDQKAIKAAFDSFDLDKSGFIEPVELALLSAQLGQVLNDEELDAAVKAIDTSGDGKIEFSEFLKWWTGAASNVSSKSGLQLALLRARLLALQSKNAIEGVAKAAAENKAAAPKAKANSRTHTVQFGMGNFDKAGIKLTARLRTDVPIDAKIAAGSKTFTVVAAFDLKTNNRPDFEPYLNELLASLNKIKEVRQHTFITTSNLGNGVVRVSVGVRAPLPDVDEMLGQMGLNIKPLHDALNITFEEAHTVEDVFTPERKVAPVDLAKIRVGAQLKLDSPMLMELFGVAQQGPRDAREMSTLFPFLTAIDSKVNVQLGDVRELVQAYYDYVVATKGENHYKARDMSHALNPITNVISKELKRDIERDYRGEIFIGLFAAKALVSTLQRDLIEVVGFQVSLRNGYGVSLSADGAVVTAHIAHAINWFSKFVEANRPQEDNNNNRRGYY